MAYIVKMPKFGMGMSEGVILDWLVSPGDSIDEGELLAEVEVEKTTTEILASEAGILRRLYVSAGESVDVGTPLGIIANSGESIDELESQIGDAVKGSDQEKVPSQPSDSPKVSNPSNRPKGEPSDRTRATPRAKRMADEYGIELHEISATGPNGAVTGDDVVHYADSEHESTSPAPTKTDDTKSSSEKGKATPKAKRLARDMGFSLDGLEGSGPGGAITVSDIEESVRDESRSAHEPASTAVASTGPEVIERELIGMRKKIAERLTSSYREAVHVTIHREIEVEQALDAASVFDDKLDENVSFIDIVLLALSASLSEHPAFNATFEDGLHRIQKHQNIGIAIDVEGGLITPVISDVGNLPFRRLVRERRELTERALAGEHTAAELSGGTFTVSNLGVLGVDSFTPIINPPEVALLGISSIRERAVRTDDGVGFRRYSNFSLSFDHRVVDGADAARFLGTFAEFLTDPYMVLIDRP